MNMIGTNRVHMPTVRPVFALVEKLCHIFPTLQLSLNGTVHFHIAGDIIRNVCMNFCMGVMRWNVFIH